MSKQQVVKQGDSFEQMMQQLDLDWSEKFLLVCDQSFDYLTAIQSFEPFKNAVQFCDFTPNPLYEDVCNGVRLFHEHACRFIVAVGGGSAIDVAKCIKLFSSMNEDELFLKQSFEANETRLLAIPTTAGTGSESTRFAVIYYAGEKQSITHEDIVPDYVILEPGVLDTLPLFQRKCTLMDAFCQAIESYWSINSTDESKVFSTKAIQLILPHYTSYLNGDNSFNAQMMTASHYAGQAINITQTTAAHAMSYKISSLFSLPHGYAVCLCLPAVWEFMLEHMDQVIDNRGSQYVAEIFRQISGLLGFEEPQEAIQWFRTLLNDLNLHPPVTVTPEEIEILSSSVNPVRLHNNPVQLDKADLEYIYLRAFHLK